jgi:GWxTD domain-containing protein
MTGNGLPKDGEEPCDPTSKNWRLCPAKYLLTKAEEKEFKSHRTPRQRQEFVKEFWLQRDPTPGTEENEFQDDYFKLVDEANTNFESPRGGWATDKGRIWILLGAPAQEEFDQNPDGGVYQVRWEYEADGVLGQAFTVVFIPDGNDFTLANIREVQDLIDAKPELIGLGEKLEAPVVAEKAAPAAPEPAAAPAAPTIALVSDAAVRILDGFVESGTARREIRFQARWDYFDAAGDTTHSVLNIGVIPPPALAGGSQQQAEDLEVFARLVPVGPGLEQIDLIRADSFIRADVVEKAPSGPFRIYQGRASLKPGSYKLLAGVRNREDGRAGTLEETVEIPGFSSGDVALSSIMLANSIEPVAQEEADASGSPFNFRGIKVVPRIEPVFRNSEELILYFQVYNAKRDPGTSKPNLDIEYQFLWNRGGGFKEVPNPIVKKEQQLAQEVWGTPLEGWPATDYKLRVTVTDNLSGTSTMREIDFKVQ